MLELRKALVDEAVKTFTKTGNGLFYDLFRVSGSSAALREAAADMAKKLPADVSVLVAPGMGAGGFAAAIALMIDRPITVLSIRDPAKSRESERLIEGPAPSAPAKAAFIDDTITGGATFRRSVEQLARTYPNVEIVCCGLILDAWHPHGSRLIHASGIPVYSCFRRHDLNLTADEKPAADGEARVPAFASRLCMERVAELNNERQKSNPILMADRVITADDSHALRANAHDGREIWSWKPEGARSKGIVQNMELQPDGALIVAGYGGMIARIDPGNGCVFWETQVAHAVHATPTIDGDGTIFIAGEEFDHETKQPGGSLIRLSPNGRIEQKTRFADDYAPTRCAVLETSVVVAANDKVLRCVSKADLECSLWSVHMRAKSRGSFGVRGGILYYGDEAGWVYARRADTGAIVWEKRVANSFLNAVPLFFEGLVILTDNFRYAHALDVATGRRVWVTRFRSRVMQRPTPVNDSMWIFAGYGGDVHLVDPATGIKSAQTRTGRRFLQPGSFHDGKYAQLSANGTLFIWQVNDDLCDRQEHESCDLQDARGAALPAGQPHVPR